MNFDISVIWNVSVFIFCTLILDVIICLWKKFQGQRSKFKVTVIFLISISNFQFSIFSKFFFVPKYSVLNSEQFWHRLCCCQMHRYCVIMQNVISLNFNWSSLCCLNRYQLEIFRKVAYSLSLLYAWISMISIYGHGPLIAFNH
mgnify:CR=1 FL=1